MINMLPKTDGMIRLSNQMPNVAAIMPMELGGTEDIC